MSTIKGYRTKVKKNLINLSEAQKNAIAFIRSAGYVSSVNPYPIRKSTLQRLLEVRIVMPDKNRIDLVLTNRGKNIALGLDPQRRKKTIKH